MPGRSVKVIFDTIIWISFLIGKRLARLRTFITEGRITIVLTDQLIEELRIVTSRKKLKNYFPEGSVDELIGLLQVIAVNVTIKQKNSISRDPKDNFHLDLIEYSKADFLVTGDKDSLALNPFKTARILSPSAFERELDNLS